MAQAKTRQPQGSATGKSQASAKANRAKAKPAATRPVKPLRTLNKTKTHRVRNFICAVIAFIFALAALLGTVTHILPEELQALPYMPIVVSLVPWFTLLAVIALVCAIISKRTVSIVMAVLAIALQAFWQYPFFYQPSYLPYAQVSSSDGVYGNGLWSASPLDDPSDDDVDSSASFMPGGTVSFNGGATQVRFVSVHTTSPTNDYWQQWKRSLDELAKLRFDTSRRYVFMGDFNATYDHTPFRNILGNRFSDASRQAGEGLKFSWPANVDYVPSFAGIDHIVLDSGMQAGQVRTVKVDGSDHKALLAIVRVG